MLQSDFVKYFLHLKFNKLQRGIYYNVFIQYLTQMVFSLYAFTHSHFLSELLVPLVLCLFLRESISIYGSKCDYFRSIWNCMDLLWIILIIVYGLTEFYDESIFMEVFIGVLLSYLWLRGLFYLIVIQKLRYLVQMVIEVWYDISGFMLLLCYSIVAFTFLFLSVIDSEQESKD